MNPKIKKQWIAELRSGEYRQSREFLTSVRPTDGDLGYCCLGVLCHIAEKEGICRSDRRRNQVFYDNASKVLPLSVVHWAELFDFNPDVSLGCLTHLNDSWLTFNQIADLIERDL